MKNYSIAIAKSIFILLLAAWCSAAVSQNSMITVNGILKDAKTGERIVFATISVPNTGIGTVSNADGEFTLKVNLALNAEFFEVSHLSYSTTKFRISEAQGSEKTFFLDLKPINLQEISVVPRDARGIVEMAMANTLKNYSQVPNMMTGFYRESVRQRRDYLSVSEAVVDIYKAPYNTQQSDQVKIFKGRMGTNVKKADTLMVQLQGGPHVSLLLDVVKNTDLGIALDNLDNYTFEFGTMVTIDNKMHWVINFSPAVVKEEPLYYGKLFISQDKLAITRAEFSLDLSDEDKAALAFLRKKPTGLRFLPTATSYLVTYKEMAGKFYLGYVRVELKFRCDWKRRLFKNNYTVISEIAITDRREDNITKFGNQELFRPNMVFTEKVQDFEDPGFWGDYNIIEPESSIESAIKKISKSMKK